MIESYLVQLQDLLKIKFNFQFIEIYSGEYALYNKIYPDLKDFVYKSLPNFINSEFVDSNSHYDKEFFLNHLFDFFSQFFKRDDQLKFQESDYNSLINDKYYYKNSQFFENLFIDLEDGFKLEFKLTLKESKKEGKENLKKFFIIEKDLNPVIYNPSEKKITVNFQYRQLLGDEFKGSKRSIQKTIKKYCYNLILNYLKDPTLLNILKKQHRSGEIDNLTYYIDLYYSKSDSDRFISNNLGKYLKMSLKNFIQEQILPIMFSSLEIGKNFEISKKNIRSFEFISNEIIDILTRIEEIKKILFFKKKFVSNTNYGLSLNKIPKEYYIEIIENKNQIIQWRENFNLNSLIENEAKISLDFLKSNPFLVVDTKNFPMDFKFKVISDISDLDTSIQGILIKSENFQALSLILRLFNNSIKCIYIDPPYNTGQNFLYNDSFKRETWLTMMKNRLILAKNLLNADGIFFSSIDDNELAYYSILVEKIFKKRLNTIIWHKKTQPSYLSKELIPVTEYIIVAKKKKEPIKLMGGYGDLKKLTELINIGNSVCERTLDKKNLLINSGKWSGTLTNGLFGKEKLMVELLNGPIQVKKGIPNKNLRLKTRFKWSQDRINLEIGKGGLIHIKSIKSLRPTIQRYYDKPIIKAPTTLLSKKINSLPTNTDANTELKNLFKISNFDYPKPTELIKYLIRAVTYFENEGIILDFFAGSGTTAQSTLELNSADNGNRKYILIEKEDYYEKLLIPRIQKIMFSSKWKDGSPISNEGHNHIYKSICLEQYSDCFWNIVLKEKSNSHHDISDRKIKYIIDWSNKESPVSINFKIFDDPFDYKINLIENGVLQEKNIDLVETFNLLLGLTVINSKIFSNQDRNYHIIFGSIKNTEKINVLVIWRATYGLNLDKEVKFLEEEIKPHFVADEIYINGEFTLKSAKPIGISFNNLMFQIENN
jgi:adenine-specific DNA-methyltransferase